MWALRLAQRDRDVLFLAASREDVTQSEFVRRAIHERAVRVLAAEQPS